MDETSPPDAAAYRAYGVILVSSFDLPELPRHHRSPPQLWVTHVDSISGHGVADGAPPSNDLHLDFPEVATFVLSPDCRRIECRTFPGASAVTVRHLLIDHVIPIALAGSGELVLHASAIGLPQGAVLILGPSGAGKSTLATVFARRGRPVLCDDGARLIEEGSRFAVAPSYPGLRLWPDSVSTLVGSGRDLDKVTRDSTKRRWVPDGRPAESLRLACVFVLDDSDSAVKIEALSPGMALYDTLDQSYGIPGSRPEKAPLNFDRAARLVESCPFFRLSYPYDFSLLDRVADAVEEHVGQLPGPTGPVRA